jgi:hypothetical protein
MDPISTLLYQYGAPMGTSLQLAESSKPILALGYELRPQLINLVQDQPFSSKVDENPYSHLCEFEQTCACLHIVGMPNETIRWKLFPFSLTGEAKRWYKLTIGNNQGDWEALCSSLCLQFFPIYSVVKLRVEVLNFKQKKKESLGKAWEHFNTLLNSSPNLTILEPILLQHLFMGLTRKTIEYLNMASGGSFMHVFAEKGRSILKKILQNLPKEREKLLEEESQIAESESLLELSSTSAILDPELPKKEETPILDFMLEFEDELFVEYGNTLNYHVMKKPQ